MTAGARMMALIEELYPICRSITGAGIRETVRRIGERIPLSVTEVPTGTPVLDWTVPREWNIRDAWIANAQGERVVDFRRHNLHVVNYSTPVRGRLTLADLRPRLHSLPAQPDLIPYRTSYYRDDWGFCLSHRALEALPDGEYDVCIDSTLTDGTLTYAECVIPGVRDDAEILVSCHCCHPSLANDNLSGIAVAVELATRVAARRPAVTYRFVFIPGTIGAITWLARNEARTARIVGGVVLTGVGDAGPLTYKQSRRGRAAVDRAFAGALRHAGVPHSVRPFTPYGHDERQYCSPGFNLPVGCLMRTPFDEYPEYHTSADTPSFLRAESLAESLDVCAAALEAVEYDAVYLNVLGKGEPQLGRRGLFRQTGGSELPGFEMALLWVLNQSDGANSLLQVADRANLPFPVIRAAADALVSAGLLRPFAGDAGTGISR